MNLQRRWRTKVWTWKKGSKIHSEWRVGQDYHTFNKSLLRREWAPRGGTGKTVVNKALQIPCQEASTCLVTFAISSAAEFRHGLPHQRHSNAFQWCLMLYVTSEWDILNGYNHSGYSHSSCHNIKSRQLYWCCSDLSLIMRPCENYTSAQQGQLYQPLGMHRDTVH